MLVYGNGQCAICATRIPLGRLMCPPHWAAVDKSLRDAVYVALRRWDSCEGTLLEVRTAQAAAVQSVTGVPQEPTLEGSDEQG